MVNPQNNHCPVLSSQDLPIIMKSKHLVDISWAITSDRNIVPPFIFLHSLRLNMDTYIKFREEVALLWFEIVVAGSLYNWQQSAVLCHSGRRTLCCLSKYFCDNIIPNIWLLNSPDFNPLDYYEVRG